MIRGGFERIFRTRVGGWRGSGVASRGDPGLGRGRRDSSLRAGRARRERCACTVR